MIPKKGTIRTLLFATCPPPRSSAIASRQFWRNAQNARREAAESDTLPRGRRCQDHNRVLSASFLVLDGRNLLIPR